MKLEEQEPDLDTLVLRATENGLKTGRVDCREDVTHIFGGVDRVETLEVMSGPDLTNISEG
jgi:hypothetical protein